MISNKDYALKLAEFLLKIKAVQLNPEDPYTWASGWKSPIYCDNRKTLSFPEVRTYIRQGLVSEIEENFSRPEVIGGIATGGIPQGALVAQEMGLPYIYVRSSAKGHGLGNQVEGVLSEGADVILVEDLFSTGGSSIKAVDAVREAGGNVKGVVSIFTYGFDLAAENFKEANVNWRSLLDFETLLEKAIELGHIKETDLGVLNDWRRDPQDWKK